MAALQPPYDRSTTMVTQRALEAINHLAFNEFLREMLGDAGACAGGLMPAGRLPAVATIIGTSRLISDICTITVYKCFLAIVCI